LRSLGPLEIVAIIGHELAHFIGEDTRLTQQFYPLRYKVYASMDTLAKATFIGWTSLRFLEFFTLSFEQTERAASREREFKADQTGASITSTSIAGRALVKFHILIDAFERGFNEAIAQEKALSHESPLTPIVRAKMLSDAEFWTKLFEETQPHPLDTHPPLRMRLASLGQEISAEQAKAIGVEEIESAYAKWLGHRRELFAELTAKTDAVVAKISTAAKLVEADITTAEGEKLLNEHFPEMAWPIRSRSFFLHLAFVGLFAGGFIVMGIFFCIDVPILGALLALAGLGLMGAQAIHWKRDYKSVLKLTAAGLEYTGWTRSLRFANVENIKVQIVNGVHQLQLHLKEKEAPIYRLPLYRGKRKTVTLTLSNFTKKPDEMAQVIWRYFTRQMAREESAEVVAGH
jgi:hypothetical protein